MKSPENILRKCAKLLGPKTNGKVTSDVCKLQWTDIYKDQWIKLQLCIIAGDGQSKCLLSVKHKKDQPYPCELDGWKQDCLLPCFNEEVFKNHIQRTLHSGKVISIISSWIIFANEAEMEDK